MAKVSAKYSKTSINSKVLMTKWDVSNAERLTRADFYTDNFHPRAAFLIPPGLTYPNERTMLKAMNEIQQGLKNGGGRVWKIVHWRKGTRMVRLEEPKIIIQEDSDEPLQVKSIQLQTSSTILQTSAKLETKSSKTSVTSKKTPRSIFTVQEHSEGNKLRPKQLRNLEEYTHNQLQKILDANKRFFQINQGTQIPEMFNTKQTKDTLNSISSTLDSNRFVGKLSSSEESFKRNDFNNKNGSSKADNNKLQSDTSSDEICSFDSYNENSESSSTECNIKTDNPKEPTESETIVKSILSGLLGEDNDSQTFRSGNTLNPTRQGRGEQTGARDEEEFLPNRVGHDLKILHSASQSRPSSTIVSSHTVNQRRKNDADEKASSVYSASQSRPSSTIVSSHTVNQRRRNEAVERENYRLSARLEAIKTQPPKNSLTFRTKRQEQLPFARIQRRITHTQ